MQTEKHSSDLKIRYNIEIDIYELDVWKQNHNNFMQNLKEIIVLICAIGLLTTEDNENNLDQRMKVIRSNWGQLINFWFC